jgi:hypothetical protein
MLSNRLFLFISRGEPQSIFNAKPLWIVDCRLMIDYQSTIINCRGVIIWVLEKEQDLIDFLATLQGDSVLWLSTISSAMDRDSRLDCDKFAGRLRQLWLENLMQLRCTRASRRLPGSPMLEKYLSLYRASLHAQTTPLLN